MCVCVWGGWLSPHHELDTLGFEARQTLPGCGGSTWEEGWYCPSYVLLKHNEQITAKWSSSTQHPLALSAFSANDFLKTVKTISICCFPSERAACTRISSAFTAIPLPTIKGYLDNQSANSSRLCLLVGAMKDQTSPWLAVHLTSSWGREGRSGRVWAHKLRRRNWEQRLRGFNLAEGRGGRNRLKWMYAH